MTLTRLVGLLLACSSIVVSRSYVIQPGTWKFRGHPIAYETAQSVNDDKPTTKTNADPVLLLNGFGVGSFHQHRLIHELLGDDAHVRIAFMLAALNEVDLLAADLKGAYLNAPCRPEFTLILSFTSGATAKDTKSDLCSTFNE